MKTRETYIPSLIQECDIGAEIGVFEGGFSRVLLEKWEGNLYLIDPWRELDESKYIDSSNHKYHQDAYLQTMNSIRGFESRAIMIRALSVQAVNLFKDNSLDFVYIDGNHSYNYVKQDLKKWYPKVKSGGYLMGHDYLKMDWYEDPNFLDNGKDKHIWLSSKTEESKYAGVFGVNPAVDEFCYVNKLSFEVTDEFLGSFIITKP